MPHSIFTCGTAIDGTHIDVNCTFDCEATTITIYRKKAGGSYSDIHTESGSPGTPYLYSDTSAATNQHYYYKFTCNHSNTSNESDAPVLWTNTYTDTANFSTWGGQNTHADMASTFSDTGSFSDSYSEYKSGTAYEDSYSDTAAFSDSYSDIANETGPYAYSDTFEDTLTFLDSYLGMQNLASDYAYYLGTSTGDVYTYSEDYYGDNGATVTSTYYTKMLDFADLYPQYSEHWKTIHKVRLIYIDNGAHSVTVKVSNDGGTTWSSSTRTVGTSSNVLHEADFFFTTQSHITDVHINFALEHTSSDATFQWLGMEIIADVGAEWFEISR